MKQQPAGPRKGPGGLLLLAAKRHTSMMTGRIMGERLVFL